MEEKEILVLLNHSYDIEFKSLSLFRKGGCHSYIVLSSRKKYFMKVISKAFMETAKQSLNVLMHLEKSGFPSPKIILTVIGLPYFDVIDNDDVKSGILFEFIEGEEIDQGEGAEKIGVLVGQMHSIMKSFKEDLPVKGKEFFIDRYIDILKKKNYDPIKIETFREYGDYLWERAEKLPKGFCHGDLHYGNLLKTISGDIFILDFDTSCYAFSVYDVMMICNSTDYFTFDENGYHKSTSTYESFLKGYTKYCSLTDYEIEVFYDLIAMYHYQLQATIIEINGLDCVNDKFIDNQLDWLLKWRKQCKLLSKQN
ncbi:MAG: phosphotransferase [Clostridia bacterium]|nr:phosphotransferase [Clostridia bacterium]